MRMQKRSPASVLILAIVTCGIYLFFWYYAVYRELEILDGRTPTGNSYSLDLLLSLITCGVWGIYVDYKISEQLGSIQTRLGMKTTDNTMAVVLLDVASYVTIFFTYFVTSAIQQDELNRIADATAGTIVTAKPDSGPTNPYS